MTESVGEIYLQRFLVQSSFFFLVITKARARRVATEAELTSAVLLPVLGEVLDLFFFLVDFTVVL